MLQIVASVFCYHREWAGQGQVLKVYRPLQEFKLEEV